MMSKEFNPQDLPTYLTEPWRLRDFDWESRSERQRQLLATSLLRSLKEQHDLSSSERYRAIHDPLTGALNRRGLDEYLTNKSGSRVVAVLMADATNVKAVNDIYGHSVGDEAIIGTYNILRKGTRPDDIIARVGGDEFIVILDAEQTPFAGMTDVEHEHRTGPTPTRSEFKDLILERIRKEANAFLVSDDRLRKVNFNLAVEGVEWQEGIPIERVLSDAEQAMVKVKAEQHKKGQYRPKQLPE